MQLIQDVFIMENLQIIEEGSANTKMKIRGTFQRAEEANNNGRIYPIKVLEGQISKLQPLIEARRLCGELDHPQNDTVKLANASHLVTKLEMKGNEVLGEAEILKTPAGLTAQALVHGGVSIGISSRGMGTLSEDAQGSKIVNEDFNLVTFDLVADPSTRGAYPSLAESRESTFAKTTQGKLQKESNFITMLESKMRDAYQPWIDEAMAGRGDTAADRATDRGDANARRVARRADLRKRAKDLKLTPKGRASHFKDIASGRFDDAFELVKADGHWHRIAEAIAAAMGYEINESLEALEKHDKDDPKLKVDVSHSGSGGGGTRETALQRALRLRSERKHAEKTEVSKAKGAAKGLKIRRKSERREALKDIKASGGRSRARIAQDTKTHKASEKASTAKSLATTKGEEQRKYDKTAGPLMRGSRAATRAVAGGAAVGGAALASGAKKGGAALASGAKKGGSAAWSATKKGASAAAGATKRFGSGVLAGTKRGKSSLPTKKGTTAERLGQQSGAALRSGTRKVRGWLDKRRKQREAGRDRP